MAKYKYSFVENRWFNWRGLPETAPSYILDAKERSDTNERFFPAIFWLAVMLILIIYFLAAFPFMKLASYPRSLRFWKACMKKHSRNFNEAEITEFDRVQKIIEEM